MLSSMTTDERHKQISHLHRIYPGLKDEEVKRTRDNLERYLLLVIRVFNRVKLEQGQSALTRPTVNPTIQEQRSSPL